MKTKYAQLPFFSQSGSLGDVMYLFVGMSCQHNLQQDKSNDRKITGQKCMKYFFFSQSVFLQFV